MAQVLGGFKAEAAGIGPAVLWSTKSFSREVTFIGKWLHEYDTENRIEGDHIFASFAMSFWSKHLQSQQTEPFINVNEMKGKSYGIQWQLKRGVILSFKW